MDDVRVKCDSSVVYDKNEGEKRMTSDEKEKTLPPRNKIPIGIPCNPQARPDNWLPVTQLRT